MILRSERRWLRTVCATHGFVEACKGFSPNERLTCDQSIAHCPICGKALQ